MNVEARVGSLEVQASGLSSALWSNRNDPVGESGLGAYSVGPSAATFFTTEHSVYNQFA